MQRVIGSTISSKVVVAGMGLFTWDLQANVLYADSALALLFGLDPAETQSGLPLEAYLDRVHHQDRCRLATAIRDSIQGHTPQQEEYRVRDFGGHYVKVASWGQVFKDRNGYLSRFVGIVVPAVHVSAKT